MARVDSLPNAGIVTALCAAFGMAMAGVPAGASHADGMYDQEVWFTWNRTVLDAVIIPAEHGQIFNGNGVLSGTNPNEANPCTNSHTRAMKDATTSWKNAVDQFAPVWLKGLVINVNVLGCDPAPPVGQLTGVDIIMGADENKAAILGITFSTRPCIALNSQQFVSSFTYQDMFNVAGHEFGHCLGLEHVTGEHPDADILDATVDEPIGSPSNPLHCPSNLNVNAMKGVFAGAFGQAGSGLKGTVSVASYAQKC